MHQEQLNVLGVVDEESLVAGGHHVAGLLVATITNLSIITSHQHSFLFYSVSCISEAWEQIKVDVRKAWEWCP